jgi:hypothetical protein
VPGNLFTRDFLDDGIQQTDAWKALTGERFTALKVELTDLFAAFPTSGAPNEADTHQRAASLANAKFRTALRQPCPQ